MGNAEHILVIILAAALAIFLLLGIVALIYLIKILRHLKHISETAEKLASTAETVGDFFKYTAGPAAVGKFLANITEAVRNHHQKPKGK